jgi:transposase
MLKLIEYMEILRLKEIGYSISSISRLTGKDRKTVRKYLNRDSKEHLERRPGIKRSSKLECYREYIVKLINESNIEFPPCTVIYEKLVERGYGGSLSLVQKWIKQYKEKHQPKVIIRYETPPGLQAQVDWGEMKITDRQSGYKRKVHIFCMSLSYSRMRFVHFVPKADMYYFLLCHREAFKYFGGIPQEILYDQNRCVLTKPGIKEINFNSRFLDFAYHYGFKPRVCRPYRPQTKGKVENSIKYVKRNFLSVQDTADLFILNQRRHKWLDQINHKVHATTQEIPFKRLAKEKLTDIRSFPEYDLYYMETRKVFSDSTFSYHWQRFSVPPSYIGKRITVKYRPNNARLYVYYKDKLITEHRTDSASQYVIKRSHRHSIWHIWRNDKRLFYQKAKERENYNHSLTLYEEVSQRENTYAQSTTT